MELGLGLISIGRPWGHRLEQPPPEDEALALLQEAVALGIRFFDTAPAYGRSEVILGRLLAQLGERGTGLFVSTKMGEFWDPSTGRSTTDHTLATLKASIDQSLARLGRIDLLQVHKATAENLALPDVAKAIDYARSRGVAHFGASVSDLEAAAAAIRSGWCSYLQFPFSRSNTRLGPIFALARPSRLKLIINRPFAMGELASSAREAFQFIRQQQFSGVILTGTKAPAHLIENHAAFAEVASAK